MKRTVIFIFLLGACLTMEGRYIYSEKIRLSTDREIYFPGEKIWFHAFCSERNFGADSLLSSVLYVELYDQQYNSITKTKYRIHQGISSGFLEVPAALETGNYFLRAYTLYSRNFSPILQTTLLLSVINPDKPPSVKANAADENLLVPEGGRFIEGVSSKAVVRFIPEKGKLPEIYVTDDSNKVVVTGKSYLSGLSVLELNPEKGRDYFLNIQKSNGKITRQPLTVYKDGILLKTKQSDNRLTVELIHSRASQQNFTLQVVNGHLQSLYNGSIKNNDEVRISTDKFEGQMLFCLLLDNEKVTGIRPVFVPVKESRRFTVYTDKPAYKPREKVEVGIENAGKFKGNAIISATHNGSLITRPGMIPGYISYNPSLFSSITDRITEYNDSVMNQIDALMILYSELLGKSDDIGSIYQSPIKTFLPEINDAGISGIAIYKSSGLPVKNELIYCTVLDESNQIHLNKTDSAGAFYFTLNHINDNREVFISSSKDSVEILINNDFENRFPCSAGIIPMIIDSAELKLLNNLYRNSQISNIYKAYTVEAAESPAYYPLTLPEATHTVSLSDYIELPVMEEVFSEILPFVSIRNKEGKYTVQIFDERLKTSFDGAFVLLDGIPVFDINQLLAVSPEYVDKIMITNRIVYIGENRLYGLIQITTKTDNFGGIKIPPSARFILFNGVNEIKYPVFPDHSNKESDRLPDFRTSLYWAPLVKPEYDISFFTSDAKGEYTITFSGMDGKWDFTGTAKIEVH